jgi:transcriptional regulator with XRE-family HTH domain
VSQSALGEQIGVTFQQVQKYERGANRVSASKLALIAEALEVSVAYFFEGLDGACTNPLSGADDQAVSTFLASREGVALAAAWVALECAEVRRSMLDLVRAVAEAGDDRPEQGER